jgi:hypothetical protein
MPHASKRGRRNYHPSWQGWLRPLVGASVALVVAGYFGFWRKILRARSEKP